MPAYNSGILELFKLSDDGGIYPKEVLKPCNIKIWYRELNIYDNMKVQFNQNQIEVNLKIAIPQFRNIDSRSIIKINRDFFTIYNIVHVTSKDGIKESEMTLIRDEGINKRFMASTS